MTARFDAIVVGAGQAGPALVGRLVATGRKVALVERGSLGGTCVNTGCTPTKALVASAKVAHTVRRAADWGIGTGPPAVDFARVMARKDAIVAASRNGLEGWLAGLAGCTVIRGHARFVSPTEIEVAGERIAAPEIFLNVGGRPAVPDLPGIAGVPVLDNASILALTELPAHLVVIGGSYIGLEFAQMFRRFGSEVTVVEKGPRLIAREDEDVSAALKEILEGEGVDVRLAAECIGFEKAAGGIAVSLACGEGPPRVVGSHVLVASGRRPNTDDLGLERAGVAVDRRGTITTDGRLRTNVAGIWALGDCNGRGAFTHTAYNDFEIVAADLLDGEPRSADDRVPVYALYTDPPLGRAGMTRAEAKASGRRVLVGRRPMTRVARAVEKGETAGFMEILVDADSDAILGACVLGVGGDEAIHAIVALMAAGAPRRVLTHTMHIHPTVAELLPTIAGALEPLA